MQKYFDQTISNNQPYNPENYEDKSKVPVSINTRLITNL